jgi:IclR family pca regulon transcriptional regulator
MKWSIIVSHSEISFHNAEHDMLGRLNAKTDRNFTSSLARGLSVLEAFEAARPRLGITELAKKTGLSKTTVFRLVHTLRALGYMIPVPEESKYMLGPKVLGLGYAVLSSLELREAAKPYLEDLSRRIGETVNLAVLDGRQLVYIERIKTEQIININLHVGSRLELYNTSMGRVLAAFQEPDWIPGYLLYLQKIPGAGEYAKDGGKKFLAILKETRAKDYAVNNEELCPGLRSVAAPVRNREGKVAGAVNVAVNANIYSLQKLMGGLLPSLQQTARGISQALGDKKSNRKER